MATTKAKTEDKVTEVTEATEAAKKAANDPNRRVKVKLFKDSGKYREPLFVRVNDYTAIIPRGVVVEIPYFVACHLEETQKQDANTAMLIVNQSRMAAEMDQQLSR